MRKSLLYGAALTTLTASVHFGAGAFATEGITTGEALRNCLLDATQPICVLAEDVTLDAKKEHHDPSMMDWAEYDYYTGLSVEIKDGRAVILDLNGHNLDIEIPINIENGSFSIANSSEDSGTVALGESHELVTGHNFMTGDTKTDIKPQFKLTGSGNSELVEPYSVLNLGKNVEVTSADATYSAIRVDTGTALGRNADRSYGAVVNILGANLSDIKAYAVYIDDGANLSINGAIAENAAKINIDYGSVIKTTKDALVSNVYAN